MVYSFHQRTCFVQLLNPFVGVREIYQDDCVAKL